MKAQKTNQNYQSQQTTKEHDNSFSRNELNKFGTLMQAVLLADADHIAQLSGNDLLKTASICGNRALLTAMGYGDGKIVSDKAADMITPCGVPDFLENLPENELNVLPAENYANIPEFGGRLPEVSYSDVSDISDFWTSFYIE